MTRRRGEWCDLGYRNRINVVLLLTLVLLSNWITIAVRASIHEYRSEAFIPRYNSFFFHGGSEGLYASNVQNDSPKYSSDDSSNPHDEKSFVR